jgi:hypothetical protein
MQLRTTNDKTSGGWSRFLTHHSPVESTQYYLVP